MLLRLRYTGNPNITMPFTEGKVYYCEVKQNDDLTIDIKTKNEKCKFSNLETFLKSWRILGIKKEIARARINH